MINKTLSAIMLCGILSGTVSASDPWGTSPRVLDEHTPSQSGSEHVKDSDMMAESARPQRAPEEELAPARRSPDFREAGIQDTMGLDATELLKQDLSETRAREREAQRQLSWMREELRKVLEELSGAKDAMEAQQCAHTGAMEEVRAQNQKLTSELIEARELNEELASAATDRDEVSRLRAQLAEFAAENERLRAELDEARAAGHGVAPAYGSGFAPEMELLRAENAELLAQVAKSAGRT